VSRTCHGPATVLPRTSHVPPLFSLCFPVMNGDIRLHNALEHCQILFDASQTLFIKVNAPHTNMRVTMPICAFGLCCVKCLDDEYISLLASPRAMLACMLLFWIRCEWCMRVRMAAMCVEVEAALTAKRESKIVKENYDLSQSVKNLTEQHELLCSIRSIVLKSTRYSQETFTELKSFTSGSRSFSSSSSSLVGTPESKASETHSKVSPLLKTADAEQILRAKAAFRRGAMSQPNFESMRDGPALLNRTPSD